MSLEAVMVGRQKIFGTLVLLWSTTLDIGSFACIIFSDYFLIGRDSFLTFAHCRCNLVVDGKPNRGYLPE